MAKYWLRAERVDAPHICKEVLEECFEDLEAIHLARDIAWDLYDSQEDLPSYEDLADQHASEWFDLSTNDFEACIADLYVRNIENSIDYWIEEAE